MNCVTSRNTVITVSSPPLFFFLVTESTEHAYPHPHPRVLPPPSPPPLISACLVTRRPRCGSREARAGSTPAFSIAPMTRALHVCMHHASCKEGGLWWWWVMVGGRWWLIGCGHTQIHTQIHTHTHTHTHRHRHVHIHLLCFPSVSNSILPAVRPFASSCLA
jgi:hypothetical protein